MVALVQAMHAGEIAAEPVLVLSSEPTAGGLSRAAELGVPTASIDWRATAPDRSAHDASVQAKLDSVGTDLVVCAGYMRIMTSEFVERWQGRMLNIHPSVLPAFRGLNTHARALDAGCAVHGCTVHEVVADLDAGPILGQAVVPVLAEDDESSLAARVLRLEHRLFPQVLSAFVDDAAKARRSPIAMFDEVP